MKKNMTRKEEQELDNILAMDMYERAMTEYREYCQWDDCTRLRTCQAYVYDTPCFYILRSYGTFVAVIEKSTDCLSDVLRQVYGYTSTSAHHIRKFEEDYGKAKWGCHGVLVAR